jgi:hypothetical protein
MKVHVQVLIIAALCSILPTGAFGAQQGKAQPIVIALAGHAVSPALRDLAPATYVEESSTGQVATTNGLNFDGIFANPENGGSYPDVNGAVGATQYVQWQNENSNQFAVYSKTTGALVFGPLSSLRLWKTMGGACASDLSGENIVDYDKAAGRWVMFRHAYPTTSSPFYVCFAISQTSDATGKWYLYSYDMGINPPDYPKLGIWPDAYYVAFNMLSPNPPRSFVGPEPCAFDRNGMLAGGTPANPICFQPTSTLSSLQPSDLDGLTPPPAGSPNYFMNLDTNSLDIWQFHVDFTTPANSTFTGPVNIKVPVFNDACYRRSDICIPQLGSDEPLRAWGDRLMSRLPYRNFGTYESILATHTIGAPSSNAVAAIRWYEIRTPLTPTIYQEGTYQPDATDRWIQSIAQDQAGDIAVGYSESSAAIYPAIAYTGRVPTDPLGTLETPESIISPACASGQVCDQIFNQQWGGYTSLSVDPVDDCTFWYTNQYYPQQGAKIWHTRIASFKFNACP